MVIASSAPTPRNRKRIRVTNRVGGVPVLIAGVVLLLLGLIFAVPILWVVGLILLLVGAVLWVAGAAGHAFAGRRHYW